MRIFRIAYLLLVLFIAACSEIKDDARDGFVPDPVTECVVPEEITSGSEVILQWNGFAVDDCIILRKEGSDYEMQVSVITGSGLIFNVPFDIAPGVYEVVLVHGGETILGTINVFPPDLPVNGLTLPGAALAGEMIMVGGVGFDDSSSVRMTGPDGLDILLESSLTRDGLQALIPEELAEGEYTLYLVQDGCEWKISSSFLISSAARKLLSITTVGPYFGSTEVSYTWTVYDEEEPVRLVLSEALISGDEITEGSVDIYEADASGSFVLVSDGFESSNDIEMTYHRDSDGKVSKADVLLYGKSQPTQFTWEYEASGAISRITYESKLGLTSFSEIEYNDGSIVLFKSSQFEYEDPSLKNNPYAPDVVWAYMALMNKFDPFMYFPYLLGWYDVKSVCLPTAMNVPSGSSMTVVPLSYEFDDKGYVIQMNWMEGSSMNRLLFDFED
ncbi:MAG: hypothetical protein IKT59_10485 [Bacteroidales bacterium]|nr:hypothetical protein [Bacteroidales bacterium]